MKASFLPLHYSYVYYFLCSVPSSVSLIPLYVFVCCTEVVLYVHYRLLVIVQKSSPTCVVTFRLKKNNKNSHFVNSVIASVSQAGKHRGFTQRMIS